jgi:peptide/nickel transport system ATP-binding protein/oligopeptide transport system ATP-binding protein
MCKSFLVLFFKKELLPLSLSEATALTVSYGGTPALQHIDFSVEPGETVAIVGESGCGKSTLGRALLRLQAPAAGTVRFRGEDLASLSAGEMRRRRRSMQMMFQDPYASLNARMTIGETLAEPLVVHGMASWRSARARVSDMLAQVGLDPAVAARYPHAFSGGQRQRIAIARALICGPELVVADEPLSALDITVQGQILDLLAKLQGGQKFACVFISHDLPVVRGIAGRVAVMLGGRIVEQGPPAELFARPAHPYTRALRDAVPIPDPALARAARMPASVPAMPAPAHACPFVYRCPQAAKICAESMPPLRDVGAGRQAACWMEAPNA